MITDTHPRPFDPGKPVKQCNGREAEILRTGLKGPMGRSILALTHVEQGKDQAEWFYSNGLWGDTPSIYDLVNVPVRREGWLAHWAGSGGCRITSALYPTREKAEQQTAGVCDIAVVISRVEWEE